MSDLMERLRSYCTPEYEMVRHGLDAVNVAMIRHWCEAMGDSHDLYSGDDPIAPPQMIGAWVMRPMVWPPPDPRDGRRAVIAALDEAGFTAIVATNTEQEYVRPLRPGDRISARISVESVSEEKQTALGPGHFFTTVSIYEDAAGEVVATERFRMLKFKPRARADLSARPKPSMNQDSAFFWEGAARSELLIQRCASCGVLRHPPRAMCSACTALEWDTLRSEGRGTVYSFVVAHHPVVPGFEPPYVVALVALDEGVRMISNVVGVAPEDVKVGMPVAVEFHPAGDDLSLPLFRPV